MNPNSQQPNNSFSQTNSTVDNFDPSQDIDISNIEIIDTSKGDEIDSEVLTLNIYKFLCRNCSLKYEGREYLKTCPRCGSDNLNYDI